MIMEWYERANGCMRRALLTPRSRCADTPLDMASGAATLPFPQNRPPIHPAVKGLFFRCLQYNS